jgi:hypothetical protein
MIKTLRAHERYHAETDWLSTHRHFSLDHYHDSANMHFGPLRVFHDDLVAPAGGFAFDSHPEREIVTYIIDGALEHRDDMGNTRVVRPGEIQRGHGCRSFRIQTFEERSCALVAIVDHARCQASATVVGAEKFFMGRAFRPMLAHCRARRESWLIGRRFRQARGTNSSRRKNLHLACWPQANPPRTRSPKDGALIFS